MRTFIENYLHFIKNCIKPPYKKLKSLKSGFIENSNFENNRDPCVPMLQRETDRVHFLLKFLQDNLSTASPAGSLKQPGPDPLWPNMLTPFDSRSKMYTLIKTCQLWSISMPPSPGYTIIHSGANMSVVIDDQLTANLSMPRSVITKLPFSPLVKNLDIYIRFNGATIPAPALAPLLVCDHFT